MARLLAAYVAMAVLCAGLDFVWMGVIAHRFYLSQIGPLLYPQLRFVPAVAFYLLYAAGIMVFVVVPATHAGAWARAGLAGLFFGLVAYGAYDLTNLATLKGFTLAAAAVDMTWGAVVTAISAVAGYGIVGRGA